MMDFYKFTRLVSEFISSYRMLLSTFRILEAEIETLYTATFIP